MQETDIARIYPAKNLVGSLRMPGDKSISHRYAMLGAIANGRTRLANFSSGEDCGSTVVFIRALGCEGTRRDGMVEIGGAGVKFGAASAPLDCVNSGSTMR